MTNPVRVLVLCLLAMFSAAQASAQEFIRIENRWKPEQYINNQEGPVVSAPADRGWHSGHWMTEPVAGGKYFRLKNRWKGTYLHNQNGALELGPVEPGWNSAMWVLEKSEYPGYHRVKNLWTKEFLHNENGSLELGAIEQSWWSAQWKLLGFTGEGAESSFAAPAPVVAEATIMQTCPEGEKALQGGGCAKEVFFYQGNGLSQQDATAIAMENGFTLATPSQIKAAWEGHGLDVYAFGRLSDGKFAVPVQSDHSNFKKGVNYPASGGNQGFFYIVGCPGGYAFESGGGCHNAVIKTATGSVHKISLSGSGSLRGVLLQTRGERWAYYPDGEATKYENVVHFLETARDPLSISMRDLWGAKTLTVDFLNNTVAGRWDGANREAKIASAEDVTQWKNQPIFWEPSPLMVADDTSALFHVGLGDDTTGLNTAKMRKVGDGKWVIAKDDKATAPLFTEIARDAKSITLRHESLSTARLDLEDRTVRMTMTATSADQALIPGPNNQPGAARITWTKNEQEVADFNLTANKLTSPLNDADLDKVMRWIGNETSAAQIDYCYRNSAPREGFPWIASDPAGDFTKAVARCESKYGDGRCELPIAVAYPKCVAGKYGDGPICWQSCPTTAQVLSHGQNTKVDCGIGCALNNDVCAQKISDMVLAPVNMALNIITLGLSGAASNSAKQAATAAVEVGQEAVTEVALNSPKWAKLSKALTTSEEIFDQITGAKDKIEYLLNNVENLETELNRWNADYENNFADLTSARIDAEIDRYFPNPDDASYIKQKFGQYQLTTLLAADEWRIWNSVATAAGVEPLGVIATVQAFAQPMCRKSAEPFPSVTIIPYANRGAPDPLISVQ